MTEVLELGAPRVVRGGRDERAEVLLLAGLAAVVTIFVLAQSAGHGILAIDFRQAYLPAGRRVLAGASPYAWSAERIAEGAAFVYPALAAILFAPLAALAGQPASVVWTGLCLLAVPATLAALGVRDRRLYATALIWPTVVAGWQTANLTLLLGLGIALIWRLRDRPLAVGLLAALLVSLKPFTWPVELWLIATGRRRAAGASLLGAVALNAVAWAIVGPGEIEPYIRLSGSVSGALERRGYGLLSLAAHAGLPSLAGWALLLASSLALALVVLRAGLRGEERRALALSVALMLCASPLVWNHYGALLLVPMAIARPRLSALWLAPILLWVCPSDGAVLWQIALAVLVTFVCLHRLASPAAPAPAR
jgi:alpha-1,2-mannosyltransferase